MFSLTDAAKLNTDALLLIFRNRFNLYGLKAIDIQAVCPVSEIIFVPQAPPFIVGAVTYRGLFFTVVDFDALILDRTASVRSENKVVLLASESAKLAIRVEDIVSLTAIEEQGHRVSSQGGGKLSQFVSSALEWKSQMVPILDTDRLINHTLETFYRFIPGAREVR